MPRRSVPCWAGTNPAFPRDLEAVGLVAVGVSAGAASRFRVDCARCMNPADFRQVRAERLAAEVGTLHKQAGLAFALCYPSPYKVGMSSLGFQTVYRLLNGMPDVSAERAFL